MFARIQISRLVDLLVVNSVLAGESTVADKTVGMILYVIDIVAVIYIMRIVRIYPKELR